VEQYYQHDHRDPQIVYIVISAGIAFHQNHDEQTCRILLEQSAANISKQTILRKLPSVKTIC
jgi:cupin superfamily acireductone dioxygenase involved in methionine salvage